MKLTKQIHTWHQTRAGLAGFGVVELGLAYGAASWAIDSGNPLLYLATVLLLVGGISNLVQLTGRMLHHS